MAVHRFSPIMNWGRSLTRLAAGRRDILLTSLLYSVYSKPRRHQPCSASILGCVTVCPPSDNQYHALIRHITLSTTHTKNADASVMPLLLRRNSCPVGINSITLQLGNFLRTLFQGQGKLHFRRQKATESHQPVRPAGCLANR